MIRTEFWESKCNVVISSNLKDGSKNKNSVPEFPKEGLSYIVKLYDNIAKCSAEFISYMKRIHGSAEFDDLKNQIHAAHPNAVFRVENISSDNTALVHRIEQLIRKNEHLVSNHKRLVGKMREKYKLDTKNAIRAQNEIAKQRFENGYKLIAAELRMFIKNYSTQVLRRIIEGNSQSDGDFNDNSIIESGKKCKTTNSSDSLQIDDGIKCIEEVYKTEIENLVSDLKNHFQKDVKGQFRKINVNTQLKQSGKNETMKANPVCVLFPFVNKVDNQNQIQEFSLTTDVTIKQEPNVYVKEEDPLDMDFENAMQDPLLPDLDNVISTAHSFSQGNSDKTLINEDPVDEEDDDLDLPPMEVFNVDYWTTERLNDIKEVHRLTKLYGCRRSYFKKIFDDEASLERYEEFCRKNKFICWEVKCLIQDERFRTKREYDTHIKKCHPTGKTIFVCHCCYYPFSTIESRKEHSVESTGKKRENDTKINPKLIKRTKVCNWPKSRKRDCKRYLDERKLSEPVHNST